MAAWSVWLKEVAVTELLVRGLDEQTHEQLRRRAATNRRSPEDEARVILTTALTSGQPNLGAAWLEMAQQLRDTVGGVDLELPERQVPREVGLR